MSSIALETSVRPSRWLCQELGTSVKLGAFRFVSLLTDPACKAHELFRRLYVVDDLHAGASRVANCGRKAATLVGVAGSALLAGVCALPAFVVRGVAVKLQREPYIHVKNAKALMRLGERSFSLLSWNICCVGGGYAISNGGVMPWSFRIERIVKRIAETDADVNCIYETFDFASADYIYRCLKERYAHIFFNIGAQTVGISSGIMVLSKFEVIEAEFTRFPLETLVGRTKNAAKGVFSFTLCSGSDRFARIAATHLQHSEESAYPTREEVAGRAEQMRIVIKRVEAASGRCRIVTGDLNLDDEEYAAASWAKRFFKGDDFKEQHTWGGDEYCARMVGQRVSRPLNLDHTMVLQGTARGVQTTLVRTGYNPQKFTQEALSDHEGIFSTITL